MAHVTAMGFKEYFRVLEILLIVPFAMYINEGLFHDCASGIDLRTVHCTFPSLSTIVVLWFTVSFLHQWPHHG